MKTKLSFFALVLIGFPFEVFAQTSPHRVAQEIVNKIKSSKSLEGAYDYLDWERAAEDYSQDIGTSVSEKSFRKSQIAASNEDATRMKESLEKTLAKTNGPQKARLKKMKVHLDKSLREQEDSKRSFFSSTNYLIGESSIEDDSATVPVTKITSDGESIKELLQFRLVNGEWKIKSLAFFNPRQLDPSIKSNSGPLGPAETDLSSTFQRF